MQPPDNAELFETPVGTSWLDENGVLYSVPKKAARTIENYQPVIDLFKKLTSGRKKFAY